MTIALTEEPQPRDQVLDLDGEHAPVYVEPAAADMLEDKVLDAPVQQGQLGFVIADQS